MYIHIYIFFSQPKEQRITSRNLEFKLRRSSSIELLNNLDTESKEPKPEHRKSLSKAFFFPHFSFLFFFLSFLNNFAITGQDNFYYIQNVRKITENFKAEYVLH